jgi:chemotaxis protein methyltransferase CheR
MSTRDDTISTRDFERLRRLIYDEAGIHLGVEKRTMLEVRLKRRLRNLQMRSYAQYCDYLFDESGFAYEIVHLIDVVTTNKTDFFREESHFRFLSESALAELEMRLDGRPLRVWSAGCSTGEEPYTLAMVLSEYAERQSEFKFHILATDIATTVLEKARAAIYTEETITPVPLHLRRKYFLRSRDQASHRVRMAPEMRELVDFRRVNLIDFELGIEGKFDVVFCRNVLIYFDRPTQKKILDKLCSYLMPRGFLFVGHSEALHDMNLPLEPVAPALYRRMDGGF